MGGALQLTFLVFTSDVTVFTAALVQEYFRESDTHIEDMVCQFVYMYTKLLKKPETDYVSFFVVNVYDAHLSFHCRYIFQFSDAS